MSNLSLIAKCQYNKNDIIESLRHGAFETPNKPFYIDQNSIYTYSKTYELARKLSWLFGALYKIKLNSSILICTKNRGCFPPILAALESCRANISIFSPTAPIEDIKHIIALVKPQLFITDNINYLKVLDNNGTNIDFIGIGDGFNKDIRLKSLVESVPYLAQPSHYSNNCDSCLSLFSSGSTGQPKAIVNKMSSFRLSALHLVDSLAIGRSDRIYVPVPFFHVYGILGICCAAFAKASLVSIEKYEPHTSLFLVQKTFATVYFGVPTMYSRELNIAKKNKVNLPWSRVGLVAGASCPQKLFLEYEKTFDCTLMQSYGMTETAATLTITNMASSDLYRSSCVGRAVNGAEIRLDHSTNEILCKSPCLAKGIIKIDGYHQLELDKGWFRTGDIGEIDEYGSLKIIGRLKDMIIRGGINIFPAEVENIYQSNKAIIECCLVGYPDEDLGERTCLCCDVNDKNISSSAIRNYAINKIDKVKVPDIVWKMGKLPHLDNGKINKKKLKKLVAQYSKNIHLSFSGNKN